MGGRGHGCPRGMNTDYRSGRAFPIVARISANAVKLTLPDCHSNLAREEAQTPHRGRPGLCHFGENTASWTACDAR